VLEGLVGQGIVKDQIKNNPGTQFQGKDGPEIPEVKHQDVVTFAAGNGISEQEAYRQLTVAANLKVFNKVAAERNEAIEIEKNHKERAETEKKNREAENDIARDEMLRGVYGDSYVDQMAKKRAREMDSPDSPNVRKKWIAKDRFEEKETIFQIKVTEKKKITEQAPAEDYENQLQNLAGLVGGRGRGALVKSHLGDKDSDSNSDDSPPARPMDRKLRGTANLPQLQGAQKLAPLGTMIMDQSNNNTVAFF
jgi:hypothetical protein